MARSEPVKRDVDVEAVFQDRLGEVAHDTEALLDRLLGPAALDGELARPARLLDAMRYVALGGGKRFRPFLVVECAALFGVPRDQALMAGAALECVHCYSLAHDDLPAMDDDDLRRGRPTAHKAFDEATAILAGDGLLTLAFDILARPETHPDADVRLELVSALARAAGLGGMVGGQMLDLAAEGRFDRSPPRLGEADVKTLQAMKTGALLAVRLRRGRDPRQGRHRQTERARPLWLDARRSVPDRRRPARPRGRSRDRRQGHRQGRRRQQGDARRRARGRHRPSGGWKRWSSRPKRHSPRSARAADVLKAAARFVATRSA